MAPAPPSPFKFIFKTLIIKQNARLQSQDPVIKVTFIEYFLNGRHSPEVFTYTESYLFLIITKSLKQL